MNSKLKPYDEYKQTNILWSDKVPVHWQVKRGKELFKYKKEINSTYQSNNILSLTLRGVVNNNKDNPVGLVPKDYASYQVFDEGDLVFKLIDLENYKTSRVGIVHQRGIMSPAYIRLQKNAEVNVKYFYYQYYDLYLRGIYNKLGSGVRSTLSGKDLIELYVLIPTIKEQDRIVRYLDWQLAIINKFIKTKKRQINLLREQKQAIITKAVTKGIEPNVIMKPSGIEWLGDIPQGWETNKLGYIGKFQNGISEAGSFFEYGYPFVSYGDVYNNIQLPFKVDGVANSNKQQQDIYSVKCGDIFFTRTSETIEEIGLSSVCMQTIDKAIFSGFIIRFRPYDNKLDKNFSKYYFRNSKVREYFVQEMNIVTRASLSQTLLKNMPIVLPSLLEQEEISKYLDMKTQRIDNIIVSIEKEINLISEYRTKLIADMVTGKVDVRSIVINEFSSIVDEAEELEEIVEMDEFIEEDEV